MKKILIVTLLFLFHHFMVCAQAPGIEWAKCLRGGVSQGTKCIEQTSDGGYIVAGVADTGIYGYHGEGDGWLIKLDGLGNMQWQKCYGGSRDDEIKVVRQTIDGGYIVAGRTASSNGDVSGLHGNSDAWIVKLNDTGGIQWQRCLGGSEYDRADDIRVTQDGGYIIAGYSESNDGDVSGLHYAANHYGDAWIVKLNGAGVIQWQRCAGSSNNDAATSVSQTPDGGFIAGGSTWSDDLPRYHAGDLGDCYVVKLDSGGGIQWQKCYGGSGTDIFANVIALPSGGYILAASTRSSDGDVSDNHGMEDDLVVRLDDTGGIQWQRCFGGSDNDEAAYDIEQTSEGGYILAGSAQSYNGDVVGKHFGGDDYWVVKLSDVGNLQWQKCLGGSSLEYAYGIRQTFDQGYVIAGFARSVDDDLANNNLGNCAWVVKLSPWPEDVKQVNSSGNILVTPNPSDGHFTVTLPGLSKNAEITITNMLGQVVLQKEISKSSTEISLANVPGVYFVCVCAGGSRYNARLVVR